jgi:hypothetical protein
MIRTHAKVDGRGFLEEAVQLGSRKIFFELRHLAGIQVEVSEWTVTLSRACSCAYIQP